jgi:hypothetical protein
MMRRAAPVILAAAIAAALLAAPAGAGAAEPEAAWWQLLTGSRPTNLQPAPDKTEVQEVATVASFSNSFAGEVEVGREVVACLGTGTFASFCPGAAIETAPQLQAALETPYGAGEVEVTGGPVGGEPFVITTPGRWVAPVKVTPLAIGSVTIGRASSKVISEGSGRLTITLTNLGNTPADATEAPLTIVDSLPPGVQAYDVLAIAGTATGEAGPIDCAIQEVEDEAGKAGSQLSCTFEDELPPYEAIEIELFVAIAEGAGSEAGRVSVSGSDAPAVSAAQPFNVSDAEVPFGLEYFSMRTEKAGGGAAPGVAGGEEVAAAGSHPFQVTTTIVADSGPESGDRSPSPDTGVTQPALPRNLRFALPPGLVPNLTAVPTCDMADFLLQTPSFTDYCPADTAIGASSVTIVENNFLGLTRIAVPVFNLVPGRGEPARFGLMVGGDPVVIDTSVDPEDEYRGIAEVRNITQLVQFLASTTTLWGDPGSEAHDASRGWNCVYHRLTPASEPGGGECPEPPEERHQTPFFRMPVSCASPLRYGAEIEPWNTPIGAAIERGSAEGPPLSACNHLPFDPSLSNALTSRLASNPSGLDLGIQMPNSGLTNPEEGAISETQFKRAEVTFPKGVTINPSAAEGLAVCSEAQYDSERYDSGPGEGCPEASKLGSVQIATPLLAEQVRGSVYQATPYQNKTGSLLGLYLVAKIPDRGILVKQPIEVRPDPKTGQIVSIADDVPQVPISSFDFHFREGGRSPLITPPGCGTFATTAKFTPWSAQDPNNPAPGEVVERQATFTIDHGVDGGACPSGAAPFNPGFEAGTLNNQAGSYSPFLMHLTRQDGEQDMGRFSFVLPPGVVPKLAGIPYCPEAGIARAQSRQGPHGGQEEIDSPSCPAASEIGRTVAGAGVGNQLTYVGGKLYLAGPYHGDPISAVSITPAVAGPFDAGVVVVREALRLNPVTHVGEVDGAASDPIPHILKGIPLNLRDLRVYADKPEFTLNPTSCEPFAAQSTIWGDGTALEPLPEHPVGLTSRFQAAGCASLGFKPKLGIKLKGGTKRGKFPALHATYTPRPGDANLSRLALTFPHSEFIEQGHFGTICTRVQFAAGAGDGSACPPASVYGHVRAWSPLLAQPLEGPVYLRSSSHNLPDAVFALHGLVNIDVVVRIDSSHGGLRATVEGAPDAPVSRAIVDMQGGKKGLFVNSTNLCAAKHRAKANATAQNGKRDQSKPLVRVKCGKAHHKRRSHR